MIDIPLKELITGLLVFFRVGGILTTLPLFGDNQVPIKVRILFATACSFAIFPNLPINWLGAVPQDLFTLFIYIVKELAVGVVVGFVAKAAFDGLLMAASLVGYQMGFGTANLIVADSLFPMNSFTAFHRMIIMLVFLAMNLHHLYFAAISDTFKLIPAGGVAPTPDLGIFLIDVTSGIFVISLQLAAPVFVALMFTMAALGLIARTVPQMNVFTMSFPFSFCIGLLVYMATMPILPIWLQDHFSQNIADIYTSISNMVRG